jgi:hypothetical protein
MAPTVRYALSLTFKYSDKYLGRDKANLQQKKARKDDGFKGTEKHS